MCVGDVEPLVERGGERVALRPEGDTFGVAEDGREPLDEPLGERLPQADIEYDGEPEADAGALLLPQSDAMVDAVAGGDGRPVDDAVAAAGEAVINVDAVGDSVGRASVGDGESDSDMVAEKLIEGRPLALPHALCEREPRGEPLCEGVVDAKLERSDDRDADGEPLELRVLAAEGVSSVEADTQSVGGAERDGCTVEEVERLALAHCENSAEVEGERVAEGEFEPRGDCESVGVGVDEGETVAIALVVWQVVAEREVKKLANAEVVVDCDRLARAVAESAPEGEAAREKEAVAQLDGEGVVDAEREPLGDADAKTLPEAEMEGESAAETPAESVNKLLADALDVADREKEPVDEPHAVALAAPVAVCGAVPLTEPACERDAEPQLLAAGDADCDAEVVDENEGGGEAVIVDKPEGV